VNYAEIKNLLTLLLPIGILCFAMAYGKLVYTEKEGTMFTKAGRFFASAIFGIAVGYVDSKFHDFKVGLIMSPIATLVSESAINWTSKNGWTEILKRIKIKFGSTTDKPDQDGK
jgi:hypothetical protein